MGREKWHGEMHEEVISFCMVERCCRGMFAFDRGVLLLQEVSRRWLEKVVMEVHGAGHDQVELCSMSGTLGKAHIVVSSSERSAQSSITFQFYMYPEAIYPPSILWQQSICESESTLYGVHHSETSRFQMVLTIEALDSAGMVDNCIMGRADLQQRVWNRISCLLSSICGHQFACQIWRPMLMTVIVMEMAMSMSMAIAVARQGQWWWWWWSYWQ